MDDKDTGLTYMQQRYYDADLGRFYANDPVGYVSQNPIQSFNRYAYGNNNPYKFVDPDGEYAIPLLCAFGGCEAAIAAVGGTAILASAAIYSDEITEVVNGGRKAVSGAAGLYLLKQFGPYLKDEETSDDREINQGRNPDKSDPCSTEACTNKNGNPAQIRIYDENGNPLKDIDVDHPHDGHQPHVHDWDVPGDAKHLGDGVRHEGREPTSDELSIIDRIFGK